jgi:ADP-heptose:LPS heptosyltransferase
MKKRNPCNVLIVCPIGLGNFIMATPAIRRLHNALTDFSELYAIDGEPFQLHLLSLKSGITEMGRESDLFSSIYTWDPDKESIAKGMQVLWELRQQNFSHVLALYPTAHWKFCLFAKGIGAKQYLGFDYPHTSIPKKLQTKSIPVKKGLHDVDQNKKLVDSFLDSLDFAETSLTPDSWTPMELHVAKSHTTSQLLEEVSKSRYYVCHPGSSVQRGMEGKRLPIEKFAELVQYIHQTFGVQCIPIGGPEEQGLRDTLKEKVPNRVHLHPTKSLGETVALIEGAAFFVGNDSGLMHMAVASGKRCVTFFGPSDEERTGPYYISKKDWESEKQRGLERGHLVLRGLDRSSSSEEINPRLRYQNSEKELANLSISEKWPLIREYLERFM